MAHTAEVTAITRAEKDRSLEVARIRTQMLASSDPKIPIKDDMVDTAMAVPTGTEVDMGMVAALADMDCRWPVACWGERSSVGCCSESPMPGGIRELGGRPEFSSSRWILWAGDTRLHFCDQADDGKALHGSHEGIVDRWIPILV